jgi:hypothetical protein
MTGIWELTTDCSRKHDNTSSVQWVRTALNDIFSESLVRGFKKFCASNNMNRFTKKVPTVTHNFYPV